MVGDFREVLGNLTKLSQSAQNIQAPWKHFLRFANFFWLAYRTSEHYSALPQRFEAPIHFFQPL